MPKIDIGAVLKQKAPRLARWIPRPVVNWLRRTIHESEINYILEHYWSLPPQEFIRACFREWQVTYSVEGLEKLDPKGRYLFASNHPFGGMDGMMLAENAELIAVMDINAEQVEKIRQKYGAKRGYTKEEDLLADPEVDAVYIATPIVLHAKQAKLAADYGKDILIEKPLAMTSDEGQAVIDYCERKGVKIAAGFMMRFGSHVMSMKKAIAEGKIGTVVSGYSQFTLWLPYEPGNWRQCKAKAGGGAMMDLSVHTIDLMEYITGMRVTEVASMNEKIAFPEPQYDVEDTSTILMRMENGAQCVVQSNFNIPDEASKWRVEFFGTKGRLLGDTMIGQIDGGKLNAVFIDKNVAYSAEQTHADDAGIEIPGDFGNMYTREIESFSDSILNNKPLVVPASDAVHVQRIMEKAYASGEELKILKI